MSLDYKLYRNNWRKKIFNQYYLNLPMNHFNETLNGLNTFFMILSWKKKSKWMTFHKKVSREWISIMISEKNFTIERKLNAMMHFVASLMTSYPKTDFKLMKTVRAIRCECSTGTTIRSTCRYQFKCLFSFSIDRFEWMECIVFYNLNHTESKIFQKHPKSQMQHHV